MTTYDLVVLGGGTAGLVAAIGSAGLGASVALVEQDRPGGDCLWTGCVPSKSLIAASHAAQRVRDAHRFGVDAGEPRVDFARVMRHVHGAIATIEPHDSAERLTAEGVTVLSGRGRFGGPGRIVVASHGAEQEIGYRKALIATGSTPTLPPVAGLPAARPLTSDTVWALETLPARLVVIGGGPIGCELGQAFARLGSRVTLLEAAPRLLIRDLPDAAQIVHDRLVEDGVDVRTGVVIDAAVRRADDVVVYLGGGSTVEADEILVAAGRVARTVDLGLDTVGVELTDGGHVQIDARLRTTASRIFAAGDVTGAPAFTHVAAYHGGVIVQNAILGLRRRVSYTVAPAVTYTDPEVAQIGSQAADAGDGARVARFPHSGIDRAITEGDTSGFTELVADRKGRLVGATIVGPAAGEMIAAVAASMRAGARLRDLAGAIHAYPTRSEAIQRAALEDLRASLARYRRPLRSYLALRRRLGR